MVETKFPIKRRRFPYLIFGIVLLFFILTWIGIKSYEGGNELVIVAGYILPSLIGIGILFLLIKFFVLDRFYYIKLDSDSLLLYQVFPIKKYYYSKIKKISFREDWLKGIDTGSYMQWPVALRLKEPRNFLDELKKKYKRKTGRNLTIVEGFLEK